MRKLYFVYNANDGFTNKLMDGAHKIISPKTYSCDLCKITHGSFREKRVWKNFKKDFSIPITFYYKDEFLKKFKSKWLPKFDFPIILITDGVTLEPLLTQKDLQEIKSVAVLISRLQDATQ